MKFAVILMLFAFSMNTFAKQPPRAEQRIAVNTGAIFTRDTSNSKLGEAYRDPSGLIWGSVISYDMPQFYAVKACKDIGARLPTREEFQSLRKYLGRDSAKGYSPLTVDGRMDVLPGLGDGWLKHWFWSSSLYAPDHYYAYGFDGTNGEIEYDSSTYSYSAVRCVSGP